MKKLVEYKKQKLEMEMRLFGQFLGVLNSKKEYIQQLENGLPGTITLRPLLLLLKLVCLFSTIMMIIFLPTFFCVIYDINCFSADLIPLLYVYQMK